MTDERGRFVIAGNKAAIQDAFSVDESFEDELKPSENVASMQEILIALEQLREGELVRRLKVARWGAGRTWVIRTITMLCWAALQGRHMKMPDLRHLGLRADS